MSGQRQITMKDIARELGISVATVSRALNNSTSISRERREMIQRYAEEHSFVPNSIAKNLRNSNKSPIKFIGVIIPEIKHYFFSAVLSGIEEEATRRGYKIIVTSSHEEYEREVEACRSFTEIRVCGIIVSLAKGTTQYSHFLQLQKDNMPLVFYDRICHGINASRIVVDDYQGAYLATSHLIETGCKRIAFCGSPMHLEIVKNRMNGYKDALRKHNIAVDESLIYECDNRDKADILIPQVLAMENHPDGFFAVNDDTAVGVTHAAKRCGLRVPEDIGVCGFTNGERALACEPMLTTIDQRGSELGRQAVDILISKVEGLTPIDKVEKRIVRTKLVVRGTTKKNRI